MHPSLKLLASLLSGNLQSRLLLSTHPSQFYVGAIEIPILSFGQLSTRKDDTPVARHAIKSIGKDA